MDDLHLPVSWDEARALVVPVLRRCTEPPNAWAAARSDPADRLVRRRFLPHLHALLALDLPEVRLFVSTGQLSTWGVGPDAAFAEAHANLVPTASHGLQQRAEYGLWQLASGDGLEPSRLLLPGWLGAFRDQVDGDPIAIAPASRVLLVGGSARVPEVERLVALAEQVFRTAQQPISPVPITVDEHDALAPLALPDDHPCAGAVAASHQLLAAYEYAAQRDQLIEHPSGPETVLQLQLVRDRESGVAWTQVRWGEDDGLVLLPDCDRVQLVPSGSEPFVVTLGTLAREAAGCLDPAGLDPMRHRARWPAAATLDTLRAAAVDPT